MTRLPESRLPASPREDPEALALRLHQIAATVGMLARGQEREAEPLSHALYLVEACLLDIETRVESLRRWDQPPMMPPTASRRKR